MLGSTLSRRKKAALRQLLRGLERLDRLVDKNREQLEAVCRARGVDVGFKEDTMPTQLVESNPSIMMGKPVIAGTRITVELILEKLAAGESPEQMIAAHPRLTREAVSAALDFAVKALRADVIYPTPDQAA